MIVIVHHRDTEALRNNFIKKLIPLEYKGINLVCGYLMDRELKGLSFDFSLCLCASVVCLTITNDQTNFESDTNYPVDF